MPNRAGQFVGEQTEADGGQTTVAGYLLRRLQDLGIGHLFGVPGDYLLGFLDRVPSSGLQFVATCNELDAAYASDGYARIRGAGALCTTYGVGELSALNGVAGAFAEGVPVVVITGAPARDSFRTGSLLHHTLGDYEIPQRMYASITAASVRLESAETAPTEIDRALQACMARRLPVYISLPADVVALPCRRPGAWLPAAPDDGDAAALREAVSDALGLLRHARRPLALAGVGLIRTGLQEGFAAFLKRTGMPYATMMLGKSVLSERHPQFLGLYEGSHSERALVERVRTADCVLEFGTLLSDLNTGGFTLDTGAAPVIRSSLAWVDIGGRRYDRVPLRAFLAALALQAPAFPQADLDISQAGGNMPHSPDREYRAEPDRELTVRRFFDRMAHFLKRDSIVLADVGVSLYGAAETLLPDGATFVGQAFYGSIGYTVGAALGAGMASPKRPLVLFVGDGAFQMACQELSTIVRNRLDATVFLLNNDGYSIERMIDDRPYDDLQPWGYHRLAEAFGCRHALDVRTEGGLEDALATAAKEAGLVFIEVHTGRLDGPESVLGAGRAMAKANRLSSPTQGAAC